MAEIGHELTLIFHLSFDSLEGQFLIGMTIEPLMTI
jgi:hypothetical protein